MSVCVKDVYQIILISWFLFDAEILFRTNQNTFWHYEFETEYHRINHVTKLAKSKLQFHSSKNSDYKSCQSYSKPSVLTLQLRQHLGQLSRWLCSQLLLCVIKQRQVCVWQNIVTIADPYIHILLGIKVNMQLTFMNLFDSYLFVKCYTCDKKS